MGTGISTDLHQFLPQRRERPVLDLFRQRQRPHEVGEIVGERVKLEPDGVTAEAVVREPRPVEGVPLLSHRTLGGSGEGPPQHHLHNKGGDQVAEDDAKKSEIPDQRIGGGEAEAGGKEV